MPAKIKAQTLDKPKHNFRKLSLNGDFALVLVVFASYLVYFSTGAYKTSSFNPILTVALNLLYLPLTLWGACESNKNYSLSFHVSIGYKTV